MPPIWFWIFQPLLVELLFHFRSMACLFIPPWCGLFCCPAAFYLLINTNLIYIYMFYIVICKLCCIVLCFIIMYFVLCCVGNKLYLILSYLILSYFQLNSNCWEVVPGWNIIPPDIFCATSGTVSFLMLIFTVYLFSFGILRLLLTFSD